MLTRRRRKTLGEHLRDTPRQLAAAALHLVAPGPAEDATPLDGDDYFRDCYLRARLIARRCPVLCPLPPPAPNELRHRAAVELFIKKVGESD